MVCQNLFQGLEKLTSQNNCLLILDEIHVVGDDTSGIHMELEIEPIWLHLENNGMEFQWRL